MERWVLMTCLRVMCLSLLLCLIAFQAYALEKVAVHFDSRKWKLGWSAPPSASMLMQEFVLDGETVENWTELVTVQFFPGMQKIVSQEVFIAGQKLQLLKLCPSLVWNNIRVSDRDSMYEWSVKGCSGIKDQSEIARVARTDEGIHVWHYAVKKEEIPIATREEWIKNLDAFTIQE